MTTPQKTRFYMLRQAVAAFWVGLLGTLSAVDPIPLTAPVATFHSDKTGNLGSVVDGVEAGPHGWSVYPMVFEKQSLVVRSVRPVEAAELDFSLYFLAGRPFSTIAEFSLSYTTDDVPSLGGSWHPLDVQRFSAEVTTLRRTEDGSRLTSEAALRIWTGNVRDDVYRIEVLLPGGRATGFRLDAFPVGSNPPVLAWNEPWDFVLTEFRVSEPVRPTTNIALHRPVTNSHPLFANSTGEIMKAESLTDGLPATIAHPQDPGLGSSFHFQIDLGRSACLDHIGLRNRGDVALDRMSRMKVSLYEGDPATGQKARWEGMDRADGSHAAAGEVDILRAKDGRGAFAGRYLRISSDNPVPLSPQLAEVEVYETRLPEVMTAWADGKEIPVGSHLNLPPGVKRLSLQIRIRQEGLPSGVIFRWRVRGDLEEWQNARLMHLDIPCPPAGDSVFEAQALHSDGQWDARIYQLPVTARVYFRETAAFRWIAGGGGISAALGLGLFVARRRAKRQLEHLRVETALANERARIAQDLHDDLGADLSSIAMLADLALQDLSPDVGLVSKMKEITSQSRQTVRRLEEIVWAVNPANDSAEGFASYFCKFAQAYLELAGVASRFDMPDRFPDHPMPTLKRHHLFLASKEAIHNSIKHGSPTEVIIRMRAPLNTLELSIEDNGNGFEDNKALAAAHGSANMSCRMEAIGGTFERRSIVGKGTSVRFTIPLGKGSI